jgi:hypothetical protein
VSSRFAIQKLSFWFESTEIRTLERMDATSSDAAISTRVWILDFLVDMKGI